MSPHDVSTGVLVSIDGPNGVGKSAAVAEVAVALTGKGLSVHCTREPSDTELGIFVRNSQERFGGKVLACLVAADRHAHVASDILPRLADHNVVLCDRYLESSLALQFLDGVSREHVFAIHEGIPLADLSVILIADPHVITNRLDLRGRTSRFERLVESSARERSAYLDVAEILSSRPAGHVFLLDNSSMTTTEVATAIVARILEAARDHC